MSTSPSPHDPESLFAEYLARREAGEALDFDVFCRAHSEHSAALRAQRDTWRRELSEKRRAPRTSEAASSFAARLKLKYGADVDPNLSLDAGPSTADVGAPTDELVKRLAQHGLAKSRYKLEGEVARGGMGAILKVWDEDLRRHLAMKVNLGKTELLGEGGTPPGQGATPLVDRRQIARFLEEAQVTGQLDHPGIVPVHELGLDSDGRVYFTMKLVKGRDLKQVFDLVFADKESWSETRALGVILKVCEAMAYAHIKGVIHRDLKPANVMVGNFGEVYVMDWGLARVLGRRDSHDIRLKTDERAPLSSIKTERREERDDAPDSPLVTMDGDVMGTPCYMSPEQARGEIEKLSPRSDVYSIGALLYHLLTREMPYVPRRERMTNHTVLACLLRGPPEPVHRLRKDVPAELAAICEKAMSRKPDERYADTLELAEDLRAFLENRVVKAYETGSVAELKKWVARNTGLAAASAAAVVILIIGLIVSSTLYAKARDEAARADKKAIEAKNSELAATAARQEAVDERDRVLGLADMKRLTDLIAQANTLWPAHPDKVGAMEVWLGKARELVERVATHQQHLDKVRAMIEKAERGSALIKALASRLPGVAVSNIELSTTSGIELTWLEQQLVQLIDGIGAFAGPDPVKGLKASVEKRLAFARTIKKRSVTGPDAEKRWTEAIASIRDAKQCPKYAGLVMTPHLGLLPIGRDRDSGLWEFAHLQSGDPAERGADGKLDLNESMGIVLVLIPGGTFKMGAQSTDPTQANFDPQATPPESPVHEVTLAPYFLSKYEMTQGQWLRFVGSNPSLYGPHNVDPEWNAKHQPMDLMHPVEEVSWVDCAQTMERLSLELPTEAQWERGARAETDTPWWTGSEVESLAGAANLADSYSKNHGAEWTEYDMELDDGNTVHAAVGSYRANALGLHDVIGNVWEWCRDGSGGYALPVRAGDGEREVEGPRVRVFRGGGFTNSAVLLRSAYRSDITPGTRLSALGVRPTRSITAH